MQQLVGRARERFHYQGYGIKTWSAAREEHGLGNYDSKYEISLSRIWNKNMVSSQRRTWVGQL
jgi:hypothetical protein